MYYRKPFKEFIAKIDEFLTWFCTKLPERMTAHDNWQSNHYLVVLNVIWISKRLRLTFAELETMASRVPYTACSYTLNILIVLAINAS